MRLSSSQMLPAVSGSSPARQLSAVDLPQPDGPSRAMNSPPLDRQVEALEGSGIAEAAGHALQPQCSLNGFGHGEPSVAQPCPPLPPMSRSHLSKAATSLVAAGVSSGVGDQAVVLGAAVLGDDILARLGRHVERHVLDRRPGVEVALVVGDRLLLGLEHPGDEPDDSGQLVLGNPVRHDDVVGIGDPLEVLQGADLGLDGYGAESARVDVPPGGGHDHVDRARGEVLHRLRRSGRVDADVRAELLEVGPGLVPALHRDPWGLCHPGCRADPSATCGRDPSWPG